jgi:FkbM family methyltransferase
VVIEVKRPEAVYYLPKGLPQHKIDNFQEHGTEPDLIPLLEQIFERKQGDIITAGVYVGGLLPTLCRLGRHVWAWDCISEHVHCAGRMLTKNGIRNCTLRLAALGDEKSTVTVTTGCEGAEWLGGESCVLEDGRPVNDLLDLDGYELRTQTVEQTTIDTFIDHYTDLALIQLDLEGYEIAALAGARETIERFRPVIIVEDRRTITHTLLETLGYRYQGTRSGDRIYIHRLDLDK